MVVAFILGVGQCVYLTCCLVGSAWSYLFTESQRHVGIGVCFCSLWRWETQGSLNKCFWSWRWECSCLDTSGHRGFCETNLLVFLPTDPCVVIWNCGAHWSAQHRLVLYCCFALFFFFHTWIRLSFHCRIYSMNVVDSSISRPSSASPSGKPSGPAVSMGSVQGHYVQQVVYLSSLYSPEIPDLLHCCACALGCRGKAERPM